MSYEDYLHSIYYDPNHAGSYGGLEKLYNAVCKEGKYVLGKAKIRKLLQKQETFTLHQHVRRKFKRHRVVVPYMDYQWNADTASMNIYAKENDGFGFFVLLVDIFSRYIWTVPLHTTKGTEMVEALESVFSLGRVPGKLRTDKGVEFKNKMVQKLTKGEGIDHFFTQNESKANFAERVIKNIKSRISRYRSHHQTNRWIDVLSEVTNSYNNTYHRSIKRAPSAVRKKDQVELWKIQYGIKHKQTNKHAKSKGGPAVHYKFKMGDTVRISHLQRLFQREYDERWTYEYFVVASRGMKQGIAYYTLKDLEGDDIHGSFYSSELSKVIVTDDTTYRIEKILKRSKDTVLVKWWGWPSKFNSWIPKSDMQLYGLKV
ncbi:hypothetical protein FSP39_000775 [Pinctada imbricata]|uniref:Integrase catalytic domain-containing protein n=1 Tax=Pinctada imbricata TaxID=66713 RepID=A0AA89BV86_PINIB|nr:hypothetical protein FSP39_000775 [Pinctada imbricata]